MTRNNLLDTRPTTFGELFSNGKIYQVPPFQRDYAWQADNWEDLWQDILAVHEQNNTHFLGTVVTQQRMKPVPNRSTVIQGQSLTVLNSDHQRLDLGTGIFQVIDGQQRFATLSILVIAVIEKINQLVEKDIEPDANRERQAILRRTYLGDTDPRSLRYSSKLVLNNNDNGFYQDRLINLRPPKNLYTLTQSEQLLWGAYEYFLAALDVQPQISESGAALADFLTYTVAQRLLFIQVDVEDTTNAYVVFETLNARGIALGAADLLKNYLFSLFHSQSDFEAAQRQWAALINTVGMENFPSFLKCFLSMTQRRVRRSQLFKQIRQTIQSSADAFELLDRLSDVSDLYAALDNPNDDFWLAQPNSKTVRKYIRSLTLIGYKAAYPALFAAYQQFNKSKFEKLLQLIISFNFRYIVVSGLDFNVLETQYNKLAIAISSGNVKSPKTAFDTISTCYVSDDKFQQDFYLLTLFQSQKKLTKYILRTLESHQAGKDISEDSFSVEHILPQNPDETWREDFQSSDIDRFIYRVGNMTPLEPSLNSSLGRAAYVVKRDAYAKSAYVMTNCIQAEEWTANAIIVRQERMAKQAVEIWSIDY